METVTYWVASELVLEQHLKTRIAILANFLKLAEVCCGRKWKRGEGHNGNQGRVTNLQYFCSALTGTAQFFLTDGYLFGAVTHCNRETHTHLEGTEAASCSFFYWLFLTLSLCDTSLFSSAALFFSPTLPFSCFCHRICHPGIWCCGKRSAIFSTPTKTSISFGSYGLLLGLPEFLSHVCCILL